MSRYNPAASSTSIIPTSNPPPPAQHERATTLRRGKTLTRPERQVASAPLLTPPAPMIPGSSKPIVPANTNTEVWDWWVIMSLIVTFWAPPFVLAACGMKESSVRQAWREKVTLCAISIFLGGIVVFVTMGLNSTFCPVEDQDAVSTLAVLGGTANTVGISGWAFNITNSTVSNSVDFYKLASAMPGQDVTSLFTRQASDYTQCSNFTARFATTSPCTSTSTTQNTSCPLSTLGSSTFSSLNIYNTTRQVGYSWQNVTNSLYYMVIDGIVLNLDPYLTANPKVISGDDVDAAIRTTMAHPSGGKDATRLFRTLKSTEEAIPCLKARYSVGRLDKISPGCFISALFLYLCLGVILTVILIRFAMACVFTWFLSARMIVPPKNLNRHAVSPMVMPSHGAKFSVHDPNGAAPWRGGTIKRPIKGPAGPGKQLASTEPPAPLITQAQIGAELFTVSLVTCYSESLSSIKATCDSLAATTYSDHRKLLFIVADGMITGEGETVSTPDHCVGLLEADERFGNPLPMGYTAVGSGKKKENRAMVYAGHYVTGTGQDRHRVPTLVIVKCGMPSEASDKKPGNRGKRDSQLILMNFFSRVTYNDRMTPLDFDLFRKTQVLMGVTPDFFEVCLMVDADTVVSPDSMTHLVNCMQHDKLIMGVCGETRIANKRQSWVTAIQVFEYFISHYQSKAFEAVFGGVTCLPGCFSMYRLKSRKMDDDDWIPVITNPDIIREYSQSEVSTLHQKNLLLLGEDRFLSTMMLRTFPNRKMMFCPQARCHTVAPDTFSVLLSQRRRWINSTVHNLMELVRVRNLCGTFCFSMQFVVFMDLVGTVTLPVAICLTGALIINSIIDPPQNFTSAIPLLLLASVLGLPAILIIITTGKLIYAAWMLPYLCALPVWNLILPVYSFWHFDDFSWGETRKVAGEGKDLGHVDDKRALVASVPLRRWEDWERSRLRRIKREERRQRDQERLERAFSPREDGTLAPSFRYNSEYDTSDASSMVSSNDDDQWGPQIGVYNENNPSFPPPPIVFAGDDHDGEIFNENDLEAILDQGFDLPPKSGPYGSYGALSSSTSSFNLPHGGRLMADTTVPRFELSDNPASTTPPRGGYGNMQSTAYYPIKASSPPPSTDLGQSQSSTSAVQRAFGGGHAKQRSGGDSNKHWGPGGPLMDPPMTKDSWP
ncbi:glycosyltransferase family 2 protein [Phaffia rhodozyma]|uniref:chitin synthase n=1 Tax=Phaffia rhodozyma TaxID=264483 RepID=A0A0F7SMD4_PHARH|nr:glycosyltransferase family 2 protein [Phaffia rhodozyma]